MLNPTQAKVLSPNLWKPSPGYYTNDLWDDFFVGCCSGPFGLSSTALTYEIDPPCFALRPLLIANPAEWDKRFLHALRELLGLSHFVCVERPDGISGPAVWHSRQRGD